MKDTTLDLMEDVFVDQLVELRELDDVAKKATLMKEVTAYANAMNAIQETDLKAKDSERRAELEEKRTESTERIEREKAFPWKKILATTGIGLLGFLLNVAVTNSFNIQGYTFEKDGYIRSTTAKTVLRDLRRGLDKPFFRDN